MELQSIFTQTNVTGRNFETQRVIITQSNRGMLDSTLDPKISECDDHQSPNRHLLPHGMPLFNRFATLPCRPPSSEITAYESHLKVYSIQEYLKQ
ncbi:hypothetical protein FGO68_gene6033 [Halteria grandinella]|uniref:Uncharacterized protein n=1 Tax=Halteria grandinella TaxID=5974 RepID=A0A8J8NBV2_HALGN|nr:hypothetical protein FGO68_gene6033 [Halteria grandinella]